MYRAGSILLAISMAAFGVRYLIYAISPTRLAPDPPWTSSGPVWAWLSAIVFIAAAASFIAGKKIDRAGIVLGSVLLLHILPLHVPHLAAHLHNPNDWTGTFELLAMFGGVLVLAATCQSMLQHNIRPAPAPAPNLDILATLGRILFALSLIVFGIQHFMYARFVATLVPSWIPEHLFWAYFTGAAFIASAISIMTRYRGRLGATWLGVMFLLWVLLLHLPRVAAAPHTGSEWTSGFVALAMCGASLVIAGSIAGFGPRRPGREHATA